MKNLSQSEVNKMTKTQRINELDRLEDLACNTDYIKNPIQYEQIARNINVLQSKILHKEF